MPGLSGRLAPIPVSWAIYPTSTTQITADTTVAVFKAPFACELIDPGHVFHQIALTKSATNYYDIDILNGGSDATGTSNMGTKSFKSTTVAALAVSALTIGTTAAWLKLDAGDYVMVRYNETGTLTIGGHFRGCFFIQYGYSQ